MVCLSVLSQLSKNKPGCAVKTSKTVVIGILLLQIVVELTFIVIGIQMAKSVARTPRQKIVHYTLAILFPIPYVSLNVIVDSKAAQSLN